MYTIFRAAFPVGLAHRPLPIEKISRMHKSVTQKKRHIKPRNPFRQACLEKSSGVLSILGRCLQCARYPQKKIPPSDCCSSDDGQKKRDVMAGSLQPFFIIPLWRKMSSLFFNFLKEIFFHICVQFTFSPGKAVPSCPNPPPGPPGCCPGFPLGPPPGNPPPMPLP